MDTTDVNLKNSTYNTKNGRYVLGGVTEVSTYSLEHWEMFELPRDQTDIVYFVEKKYESLPHLLGYLFYGDEGLWWVICQYNGIIDPFAELVEGKMLLIPTTERVKASFMINNLAVGGIPSTRVIK
jgi:hypothetical protein